MGNVFRVMLVALLLVVLGATGLYVAAQQRSASVAGLPSISPDANDARSADAKIAALQSQIAQAARASLRLPVSVMFTEQELTAKVAQYLAAQPNAPLQPTNVQVHLRNGNVILTATVQVQGLSLNVGVTATPQVSSGTLRFVIQSVDTGGIVLPDFVKQQVNAALAPALDPSVLGIALEVTGVQIANGQLTLQGVTK